jgi:hypothetical protein
VRRAGAGSAGAPLSTPALVALSACFVTIWGAGFVASRIALQYAAPFTYIGMIVACVGVAMVTMATNFSRSGPAPDIP